MQACQEIIEQWREAHPGETFDIDDVTLYAWKNKLIDMPRGSVLREWRSRFSRAATKRHVTDQQGRRVPAYVPLRVEVPGKKKQKYLWDWYSTMSSEHAHGALQQKWDELAGRCKSLNTLQCSINDNNPNMVNDPSQLTFDFTNVIEPVTPQVTAEIAADEIKHYAKSELDERPNVDLRRAK